MKIFVTVLFFALINHFLDEVHRVQEEDTILRGWYEERDAEEARHRANGLKKYFCRLDFNDGRVLEIRGLWAKNMLEAKWLSYLYKRRRQAASFTTLRRMP